MKNNIEIIKQILEENNLTQAQLAERLNIQPQFLSNIMTGKKSVGFNTLNKLRTHFPKYYPNNIPQISDTISSSELVEIRKAYGYSQAEFAKLIGISNSLLNKLESGERTITDKTVDMIKSLAKPQEEKTVDIMYLKDKTLTKGYQRSQKTSSVVTLSKRLLSHSTDLKIDVSRCRVVQIGNDMISSQYQAGDLVIIDESFKNFINGHLFAFEYQNQFYVREIYIQPKKIKCVPLNEKQDTFCIDNDEEYNIVGLILPRVRF